jgi:hypothetical protein
VNDVTIEVLDPEDYGLPGDGELEVHVTSPEPLVTDYSTIRRLIAERTGVLISERPLRYRPRISNPSEPYGETWTVVKVAA